MNPAKGIFRRIRHGAGLRPGRNRVPDSPGACLSGARIEPPDTSYLIDKNPLDLWVFRAKFVNSPEGKTRMAAFQYKDGVLHCEGAALPDIAEAVGTPFYAYSRKRLLDNFGAFASPLGNTDHLICFALKANSNPSIVRLFAGRGAGADIVSGGELRLAMMSGVPADRILYSGAGKTDSEIELAIERDLFALNVESIEELGVVRRIARRVGKTARVSIRVNPEVDPKTHPYIATGLRETKFGIPSGQALGACLKAAGMAGIRLAGVQCHIGSMVLETSPFEESAEFLAGLIRPLLAEGIPLEFADVGGGLGIDYTRIVDEGGAPGKKRQAPPSPGKLFDAVRPALNEFGLKLVFEPGRFLVADSAALVTRVTVTKSSGAKRFAIVDAGMNDLIRPSLYDAYHQIVPVRRKSAPKVHVDVVGPICESGDFFAHDRPMTEPKRGDLLAVTGAGAYGYSLASNYNGRPRAPEVLVHGRTFEIIRERESLDALWRGTGIDAS
jgi:diaminopimelate decarboxylase